MFTGIIEAIGSALVVDAASGGITLAVSTPFADAKLGESIAVNGVCLTVNALKAEGELQFFLGPETLAKTAFGARNRVGESFRVNLERSLLPTSRLSGHFVQGHVDGVGQLRTRTRLSGANEAPVHELEFTLPPELLAYCIPKGSISLHGTSLTLNAVGAESVTVQIIPHTWSETMLSDLAVGDAVNVEADILTKTMAQFLWNQNTHAPTFSTR